MKTENNFCYAMFTLLLYGRLKYLPLALTRAVRWWQHRCTAHNCMVWHHLINKQSWILCTFYWQCQFNKV